MKVALIDCTDGTGHHARYAEEIAIELAKQGHEAFSVGSEAWCDALSMHTTPIPIPWRFPNGLGYFSRNREFVKFCRLSIAACNDSSIDIAHFLYIDGFLSALVKSAGSAKSSLAATLHWYPFLTHSPASALTLKDKLKAWCTVHWAKSLSAKGVAFAVHSKEARRALALHKIHNVQYIAYPNFDNQIRLSQKEGQRWRQRLGISAHSRLHLCFGGTREDKGVDLAIKALGKTSPENHLLIAGQEQHFLRSTLEKIARDAGAADRVHFDLRIIPDQELSSLFSSVNFIVLPYRSNFGGQSGPLITARSLGMSIISSRLKVFEETLSDYPHVTFFSPNDVSELGQAMSLADCRTATDGRTDNPDNPDELSNFRTQATSLYVAR